MIIIIGFLIVTIAVLLIAGAAVWLLVSGNINIEGTREGAQATDLSQPTTQHPTTTQGEHHE